MTFEHLFRILKARKKLASLIFASTMLLTLIVSVVLPKTYKATATVVADIKPDPVSGLSQLGVATQSSYLVTQADIIQSANVAQRVIRSLHLMESKAMRDKWVDETESKGDYEAWLGERIGKGLIVKPSRDSNVLEITYKGADPKFSAALANAYAKSYIDSVIQMKIDPARSYADFFEERSRIAREKLEKAQQKLAEAQKARGIVVTDERMDVETSKLTELGAQLVLARAQLAESSSRDQAAKHKGDNLSDVLNNPVVAGLKSDISRLQSKLHELESTYGDNYPQVRETRASIHELEARMRNEIARVQNSVAINNDISQSREAVVQAAFDEQRTKLLKLKEQRTELAVLEQEVTSAQRIYDALQSRLSQVNLESNSSQSNIYLLSPATEPSEHSSPRLLLNMLIAFFPATLFAVLGCLGVEMRDRRVRSVLDLRVLQDIPVLGTMPGPNSRNYDNKRLERSAFGKYFSSVSPAAIKNERGLVSQK
ncbi:chain length determinant protein EpsF [Aquabacterium sp. NJ1]|uniref:chain length determinant protein EpsF n=1 Tax=Aquabacterium sp. NJ1 TaxID=1538295 RepID=UPI0009DF7693|nr:chain length determinant protein EpsF [Aquabacterium sp. NJ1]